eukprot:jgi/Psemu1/41999/gm1.41999_g
MILKQPEHKIMTAHQNISQDDDPVPEEASKTVVARASAKVGVQALPKDDSQAARTKNYVVPPLPKKSRNSQTPSKGTPEYISQDNDVPEGASKTAARTNKVPAVPMPKPNAVVGNPKANIQQRKSPPIYPKAKPSLSEEDLDYRQHWRSVEKNLGLALNVFHFFIHYKDLVTHFYRIHFDFDKNIVTLLPSETGEGKICLAPPIMKQGIVCFVKEWLIKKMASKLPHVRSFGLENVNETIEGLALTEQIYLAQSHFEDKEYKGFQHDDCLYIYPPPRGGVDTKYSHVVRFKNNPGELIKGLLELLGIGRFHQSATWFRQYLSARKWKNIHPVDRSLTEAVVELSDELFTAKLKVVFLSQTNTQNIDEHFGKEGNEVYLSGVFKHLEGTNFKYHTLSDFETWDCFEDTKADLQNFKETQTGSYVAYAAGWYRIKDKVPPRDGNLDSEGDNKSNQSQDKDNNANNSTHLDNNGDNKSDQSQDKGNHIDDGNVTNGSLDNGGDLKPMAKNSNESGNTAKTVDRMSKLEESVQALNYSLNVTVLKFLLTVGHGFVSYSINVMLKDPDPEILYPIYQIGDEYSNSSSDSTSTSDNEKGLEYDPNDNVNSEAEKEDLRKQKAAIWIEALDYVHYNLFQDHEKGNTCATNHIWDLGIILSYLLVCDYPALNGKADIHCYDTIGIGPKFSSKGMVLTDTTIGKAHSTVYTNSSRELSLSDGNSYITNAEQVEEVKVTAKNTERKCMKEQTIQHWLHLYHKSWNSPEDLEEYNNNPIPCGAWGHEK